MITTIDVQQTLKAKLDRDFHKYVRLTHAEASDTQNSPQTGGHVPRIPRPVSATTAASTNRDST